MGIVDTTILFVYLALLIGLGFYAKHRQKGIEDYFVAGRRMGPIMPRSKSTSPARATAV